MSDQNTDYDWFKLRAPGRTTISRSFENAGDQMRILHRVIDLNQSSRIERDISSNLILLTTAGERVQLKVVLYEKENAFKEIILQRFKDGKPDPLSFSFKDDEFAELIKILHTIKFIDFQNKHNFKVYDKGEIVILPDSKEKELLDFFNSISGEGRKEILQALKGQNFTKEDLDILSGRRDALDLFYGKLRIEKDWTELQWQEFFELNTWIFGYGLSYKFLKILQREAYISDIDIDGKNAVKGDYLLGDSKFTVLVEVKRPDTPILKTINGDNERGKNRSDSWSLSNDLIDAVSQILAQKSNWQIKGSLKENFNSEGEEIIHHTFDPKTILIIGDLESIQGTQRTIKIKQKTFELFRRDSRNIEIITYNELYERAYFLVNQKELIKD